MLKVKNPVILYLNRMNMVTTYSKNVNQELKEIQSNPKLRTDKNYQEKTKQ